MLGIAPGVVLSDIPDDDEEDEVPGLLEDPDVPPAGGVLGVAPGVVPGVVPVVPAAEPVPGLPLLGVAGVVVPAALESGLPAAPVEPGAVLPVEPAELLEVPGAVPVLPAAPAVLLGGAVADVPAAPESVAPVPAAPVFSDDSRPHPTRATPNKAARRTVLGVLLTVFILPLLLLLGA
ncbi:MAG TPA: hypothetical protein VJ654_04585 [Noviherbaspirillum sp.]|nr:hypothetical protein [Noviherbaspirillum sp.]